MALTALPSSAGWDLCVQRSDEYMSFHTTCLTIRTFLLEHCGGQRNKSGSLNSEWDWNVRGITGVKSY